MACVYVRGQKLEESEASRVRVELERLAKRKQYKGKGEAQHGQWRKGEGRGVATLERLRGQANETS